VAINTGVVTIDYKAKSKGREGVMVAGQIRLDPHDTLIRPQDIELRTIRSIILTPQVYLSGTSYAGSAKQAIGSIGYRQFVMGAYLGSIGVLDTSTTAGVPIGNYARLRAVMVGSLVDTVTGTAPLGMGSITTSFLAFGN